MKSRIPLLLALSVPLFVAVGCQRGEQGQEAAQTGMEASSGSTSSMAAPANFTMMTMNTSGVMGTVEIKHNDQALDVKVELSGLTPGETYPAHIHRGSCDAQGPVAAELGSVTASADGTGTIEKSVPISDLAPTEGGMGEGQGGMSQTEHAGFFVQAHLPDGTPAACVDIKGPARSM